MAPAAPVEIQIKATGVDGVQRDLRLVNTSSLMQAAMEKQKLYSGDPLESLVARGKDESELDYIKRTGGQLGLAHRVMQDQASIDRIQSKGFLSGADQHRIFNLQEEIKEFNRAVGDMGMQLSVADARFQQLLKTFQAADKIGKGGDLASSVGLSFSTAERGDYFAALLGRFRAGVMGDQENFRGATVAGKSILTGGVISGLKIKAADIPPDLFAEAQGKILEQWDRAMHSMQNAMVSGIANTLSTAISDAFRGNFAAIGKDVEAGLGNIIESMGSILVQWGAAMLPLASAFSSNPLTAAIEAIGIGILLEGLGKALGGAATANYGGGGSGGYGASGAYASQNSLAGRGNTTVIVKGGQVGWDINNPDDRASFADFIRSLSSTGEVQLIVQ
jgi:hypothetical protein